MNKHIFLFTLGPVQSFIAQARKTQDLFAGSQLLSKYTHYAFGLLEQSVGKQNIELIFPSFKGSSNPNRFAAEISNVTTLQIKAIGSNLKSDLITDFVAEAEELLTKISNYSNIANDAKAQLQQHWEVYWAAIPLDGDDKYRVQQEDLLKFMSSAKNTRLFDQMEEEGRKCSVDGIRNALFVRHNLNEQGKSGKKPPNFTQPTYCEIPDTDTRLVPGEGLSAVSMFKRLYDPKGKEFPSTAKVALMEKLRIIKLDSAKYTALKAYKAHFNKKKEDEKYWDEQLLLEENLSRKYFLKHGLKFGLNEGGTDLDNGLQDDYKKLIKLTGKFAPSYYAILLFDGDAMGDWFNGSNLEKPDQLKAFQLALKDHFHKFAKTASDYLDSGDYRGKTIYAGGDDFLGLVNLHHLLDVVEHLRAKFKELVSEQLLKEQTEFKVRANCELSFSAGVAIAHYKEPLGIVLQAAREAEERAKKQRDRGPEGGQLCFSVIRHSGGTTQATLPFGAIDEDKIPLLQAFKSVVGALTNSEFSNQFIHGLEKVFGAWEKAEKRNLFDWEAKRQIARACMLRRRTKEQDGEEESKEVFALRKKKAILDLQTKFLEISGGSVDQVFSFDLQNSLNLLSIADFIYRTTKPEPDENA